MTNPDFKSATNYLLYDGECPFCTSFSRFYEAKQAFPNLTLISMRDAESLKKLNLPPHLDFNQGMILVLDDGRILQGEPAFQLINKRVNKSSIRDQVMVGINSIKPITKIVYPILFYLRLIVLKIKGIPAFLSRIDLK